MKVEPKVSQSLQEDDKYMLITLWKQIHLHRILKA